MWLYVVAFAFIYWVVSTIQYHILQRKLKTVEPFHGGDRFFGFKAVYDLSKKRRDGTLLRFISDQYTTYKLDTFKFMIAGGYSFSTRDPENVKAVLATQFNDFELGRFEKVKPLLGSGIFSLDGQGWKHSRQMLRPQFAREQVGHVQMLEPHIQILKKHISKYTNGTPFDIQELLFRFTIDTATEFLFGESCHSLMDELIGLFPKNSSDVGNQEFAQAFSYSQVYLNQRMLLDKFYFLLNGKKFKECNKVVHKFTDFYVKQVLELSPEELDKKSESHYVFLYELAKSSRDPQVLRDQSLNILLAGRDTTAGLLSFTFYELARNPTIWNKLREEIVLNFGSDDSEDVDIQGITFESLKRCEYLRAVINEALRLYPSVPQNFRVANKNTTLPRGGGDDEKSPILVKKGQMVFYNVYSMHRNTAVYGANAEEFVPERWFEADIRTLGWNYLPFNGGPRICLGQQFALTEASYVIARICMMFPVIKSFEQEYPPHQMSHLTMYVGDHNHISLTK